MSVIETVERAITRELAGDDIQKLLRNFNDREMLIYREMIDEVIKTGEYRLYEHSWRTHYVRRPPTVDEFIDNEYWLGLSINPELNEGVGLYPAWREILLRDFDLDSQIHNVVITGSLGIGKTTVGVVLMLYRLTLARLLKNPQLFYNLTGGSKIVYNILSVTKQQVTETAFGAALGMMARSPFFLEECHFDPDSKYSSHQISLGRGINLTAGSRGQHILGRNVLGVLLDEGNFRLEANPDTKAYDLYNEVRMRISNRFMKLSGFLPAISILASSARDESSFTEKVIEEINNAKDPMHQVVYRNAVYKIKRHEIKFDQGWFCVAYGLKNMIPLVLTGWYDADGKPIGTGHQEPPAGARIELVPEDYLPEFKRRPIVALQSVCGISVGGSNKLFSSTIDIDRCLSLAESSGVVNPMKPGIESVPMSLEDDQNMWDYLDHPKFLTRVQSQIMPLRHPNAKRFAHFDLASTSQAGLAICHLVGSRLVEGLVKDGKLFSEYRLIVEYDFILSIVAGTVQPINLEKVFNLIYWLTDKCSYQFETITADQYQSMAPLQALQARGFNAKHLSVDKDKAVYIAWRSGFEELRILPYSTPIWIREAENLINGDKKVDHQQNGTKDVTDGMAGAYWNAITSDAKFSMTVPQQETAVHADSLIDPRATEPPPISISLPKGYTRIKTFDA